MNEETRNMMNTKRNDDIADPLSQEYSDVVNRFFSLRDETTPDDALRDRIFADLRSSSVTSSPEERYDERGVTRGVMIARFIRHVFSMENSWKTALPVAVVVLLVGVAVGGMSGGEKSEEGAPLAVLEATFPVASDAEPSNTMMMAAKMAPVSSASGNIDDIIAEIDREADSDSALFADADLDVALVNSDAQVISDYAQAYDETSF